MIASWQWRSEILDRYLTEEEAEDLHSRGMRFLKLYRECAQRFSARGQIRFMLRPKLHATCMHFKAVLGFRVYGDQPTLEEPDGSSLDHMILRHMRKSSETFVWSVTQLDGIMYALNPKP